MVPSAGGALAPVAPLAGGAFVFAVLIMRFVFVFMFSSRFETCVVHTGEPRCWLKMVAGFTADPAIFGASPANCFHGSRASGGSLVDEFTGTGGFSSAFSRWFISMIAARNTAVCCKLVLVC